MAEAAATEHAEPRVPHEPLGRLFLRFLRFGSLAWGGPVAQIAMIRAELVDEQRWVSRDHFNRALAVYQVLPGPEAHELCVYYGMLARGRIGGLLAGLGFMLPGFVLMFALSWAYLTFGISPAFAALFLGMQAAVVALIVRAVHRIGEHALHDRWLQGITVLAFVASVLSVHFAATLVVAGLMYALARRSMRLMAITLAALFAVAVAAYAVVVNLPASGLEGVIGSVQGPEQAQPGGASAAALFVSGLKAGLLTFGGAYTVIPFLQQDAVALGAWMTNRQFLDGLALSGILPAPLIIFSTFVGYFGGGALGALAMTIAIFLPAFAFTLVGHDLLERLIGNPAVHTFLDGVTAGVVGLIAATTVALFRAGVTSWQALLIFVLALAAVYAWKAKAAVAGIVVGAGALGFVLFNALA